jgi:hypothetical protein
MSREWVVGAGPVWESRFAGKTGGVGEDALDGDLGSVRIGIGDIEPGKVFSDRSSRRSFPWSRSCMTLTLVKSLVMEQML